MHTARIVVLLALFSCAAAAARAQYPQRRDGFWIGFGLGYGSANIRCDNCVDSSSVGGITASVYLYPATRSGFFVTGGLGLSTYHANTFPSSDGTGLGLTAGAGYDIRVGRDVSLTPVVNLVYGARGDFDVPASGGGLATARGWKQHVIDFGLGVTFH